MNYKEFEFIQKSLTENELSNYKSEINTLQVELYKSMLNNYSLCEDKTEPMPKFWWLNPWAFCIQQWKARERGYSKHIELSKLYAKTNAELYNLRKQNKWQLIKTAPKDGTQILLYCGDWSGIVIGHYGELVTWNYKTGNKEKIEKVCWQSNFVSYTPTHWMPLPELPQK